ncbi:MAG: murein transglycosylase [bacterium]|nr:murein transglycosylase [bacterium]
MKPLGPALLLVAFSCRQLPPPPPDYGRPLPPGAEALLPLDPGEIPPDLRVTWSERGEIVTAIERSIDWTRSKYAEQFFPKASITHARALASLERFAALLEDSDSADIFDAAVQREFQWYKSAGWDGRGGGVLFTGYCTPILDGSERRDTAYQYPLYAMPDDLVKDEDGTIRGQKWAAGIRPYPTRRTIEASHMLEGRELELVWLRDPIDAFIAHVNGSAFVRLREGGELRLGYAGKNGRDYTSLGGELVADGHLEAASVSLPAIREWGLANPGLVEDYLHRNDSYVFFTSIDGNPYGSLNFPVQGHRTLATDKRLFPRAAITFVDTKLPAVRGGVRSFKKLMFDQDTGGAIRTAGRADIYLGIGPEAERRAGTTRAEGQLYYLFLR